MGPTSREREYFLRIVWPPCSPDTLRIVVSDGVMKADYIFFSTHVSLLTSLSHTQYRQGRSGRWREVEAMKVGIGTCSSPSVFRVESPFLSLSLTPSHIACNKFYCIFYSHYSLLVRTSARVARVAWPGLESVVLRDACTLNLLCVEVYLG